VAEIVSKPTTDGYRNNYVRTFTRVRVDSFDGIYIFIAKCGDQELLRERFSGKELTASAENLNDLLERFWGHIPGLTPEEGKALMIEAVEDIKCRYVG